MKLHTNEELFNDAVVAAAQHFNIPEIFIEKDYWVTVALHALFNSPIRNEVVFKGGTALSKCYKLINRFSEDVDLVVLNNNEKGNQLKNKIKAVTEIVSKVMPEIEIEGITNKMGQIRKTAHQYNKGNFKGAYGQVRENIIVEATWLGSSNPFTEAEVSCYITDMMMAKGQDILIQQYNVGSFKVQALSKKRTFCEKIMSLVRFSYTQDPYYDLSKKIRHIYDLHMMLKNEEINAFFYSSEFDELLLTVGKDDMISYKNNNAWLKHHPAEAIIYSASGDTWKKIKGEYQTQFKDLLLAELPPEEELITTLNTIADRLKKVDWSL
jgi:predicted nucleotidyltransferase component of viral defense system